MRHLRHRIGFTIIAVYEVLAATLVLVTDSTTHPASWVIGGAVAAVLWIEEPRWRGERE